jgi:hypothetical protein
MELNGVSHICVYPDDSDYLDEDTNTKIHSFCCSNQLRICLRHECDVLVHIRPSVCVR